MLNLNSEIASFYLFHPDDLRHRAESPSEWMIYDFAIAPEFAAGRLVAFVTGADGVFRLRLTQGPLTDRELQYESCAWSFRYQARHGRVLIDGGDYLPGKNSLVMASPSFVEKEPPEIQWYAVPDGDYRVTVHAIDWTSEPGSVLRNERASPTALPAYVIRFQPEPHLESIEPAPGVPRLEPGPGATAEFFPLIPEYEENVGDDEDFEIESPESCPVIVAPDLAAVPGTVTKPLTMTESDVAWPEFAASQDSDDRLVVLMNTEQAPGLGVLCTLESMWGDDAQRTAAYHAVRLVDVTKLTRAQGALLGDLGPLDRPPSQVSSESIDALKAAYADAARPGGRFQSDDPFPAFQVEQILAVETPSSLTNALLRYLPLTPDVRERLLPLSDSERVEELLRFLKPESPSTVAP